MLNFFSASIISLSLVIAAYIVTSKEKEETNYISAYYNVEGSFAGFIQKKRGNI